MTHIFQGIFSYDYIEEFSDFQQAMIYLTNCTLLTKFGPFAAGEKFSGICVHLSLAGEEADQCYFPASKNSSCLEFFKTSADDEGVFVNFKICEST